MKRILLLFVVAFVANNANAQPFLTWANRIGSTGNDWGTGIGIDGTSFIVDGTGNVYISGRFQGTADFNPDPLVTNNLTSASPLYWDIFFAKYDANGNYIWAKRIGSAGIDYAYYLATDGTGNVYIAGYFSNTADFDPGAGIANLTSAGDWDIFFAKYSQCLIPTITGVTPDLRCGTGIITLSATASAGTINWYAASTGGVSLGTGTSFVTPAIAVTTTYYVDATDGGCITQFRIAVIATVNPLPAANITSQININCNGGNNGSATVTASGGTPGYTYSWSTIPAQTNATATGLSAGEFTVTVTDINNCTTTASVTIAEPAAILPTITGPLTYCTGSHTTLDAGSGYTSYVWSTGAATQTIIATIADNPITVTVTDANGCSGTSPSVNVTEINIPTAYISVPNCLKAYLPVQFSTVNQSGVSYLWDFGDGTTSTDQNPTHIFNDFGFYQVSLTATHDVCGSNSKCKSIFINPASYNCTTLFNIPDNTIISGDTWNATLYPSGVKVEGNVYVPDGQILTIDNITVLFAPRGRLVVKEGGRLIINNSILNGLDGCMWQGIEVWGAGDQPSTNLTVHGMVTITGASSTISNAYIGVLLGKRLQYGQCHSFTAPMAGWDTQKSGGVIRATNTNFTGNGVDIRFTSKSISESSENIINGCTFTCPATGLKDTHYDISNPNPYPNIRNSWAGCANANKRTGIGIVSAGIAGLKITTSAFNNLEYGIYTFDNKQTFVTNCNFTNHRQGIHIENYIPSMLSYYDISGCTFDNIPGNTSGVLSSDDGTAIYTAGSYGDRIHDGNQFKNTLLSPQAYGIKTNNASGFEITNNEFRYLTNGVIIQNSGLNASKVMAKASSGIYSWQGNKFTQCKTGITTWDNNSKLCLRCNDHNNGTGYIVNWKNNTGGIMADQGYANSGSVDNLTLRSRYGAGNTFAPNSEKDINSPVLSPYNYYHHIAPQQYIPVVGSSPITLYPVNVNVQLYTKSQFCQFPPTFNLLNITLPVSLNAPVFLRIDSLNNVVLALESQYLTLIGNADKGHTSELLNAINAVPPTGRLKNMLIADSPLSDTVLITLNTQNPLSNGNYKNVMDENLPVTRNVVPSFSSRVETLHPGIKNQLKAKQADNPGKITPGYLETILNQARLTKQLYFNEIISLLLDTINNRKADAITLFENEATPAANMILAATYISDSNYSAASAKIAMLPDDNPQYSQWKEYATFLLNYYAQGKTIEELDSSQVEYVRTVAYQCPEGMAAVNAKAILMYLFREQVPACPVNSNSSMRFVNNLTDFEDNPEMQVKSYLGNNYPDPFGRNTIIPYYLPEGCKGEIEIKDVTGRVILTLSLQEGENTLQIDSKSWANGIYFYGMKINNENIENKKMIKTE